MEKSETLPELIAASNRLTELITSKEGEITPEIEERFDQLLDLIADKADGYFHIMKRFESEVVYWQEMADRFQKTSDSAQNMITRIQQRLKYHMQASGLEELNGKTITWTFKDSAESVVITDELLIPDAFWRVTREISKQKIKEVIKNGLSVPGAALESTSKTLRSKINRNSKKIVEANNGISKSDPKAGET